jgi:hypothetical protein
VIDVEDSIRIICVKRGDVNMLKQAVGRPNTQHRPAKYQVKAV